MMAGNGVASLKLLVGNGVATTSLKLHPSTIPLFALSQAHVVPLKPRLRAFHKNIATGETSQAITPFHLFDNFNFHHKTTFITS